MDVTQPYKHFRDYPVLPLHEFQPDFQELVVPLNITLRILV